jgi:hypothetical protein
MLQLRLAAADSAAYCCALADLQSAVGMGTLLLMTSSKLIFKVDGTEINLCSKSVFCVYQIVLGSVRVAGRVGAANQPWCSRRLWICHRQTEYVIHTVCLPYCVQVTLPAHLQIY